jgi:hypothetical protein
MGTLQSLYMFESWWAKEEQEQIIWSYYPDIAIQVLKKL